MEKGKAPLAFRKEWIEQVTEIYNKNKSLENADKIPRVATPLLDAKPEAYVPHVISLGPYHHWTLERKIAASSSAGDNYEYRALKMSTMEAYKVQSAAKFWQDTNNVSLNVIVEKIREMQQQIEDFYDWPINKDGDYPHGFALMMAIDSSFLLHFLRSQSDDGMKRQLEVSIKCDIMKLENQIPLFVLRDLLLFTNLNVSDFSKLLQETSKKLSPFDQLDRENNDVAKTQTNNQRGHSIEIAPGTSQISDQLHLLGCVHAVISPVLHVKIEENQPKSFSWQRVKHPFEVVAVAVVGAVYASCVCLKHPYEEGRHDILNSYNAGELNKAGIQFQFFSQQSGQIRFDKYSGTLYLPQITVSEIQTEVFFRNMLALELNAGSGGYSRTRNVGKSTTRHVDNPVTRYVGLMDCLINTAEDVRLLRESDVILRGSVMVSDASIADMWNGLCHPIFAGHLEPPEELNSALREVLVRKYYISKFNKVLWEFYWDHLSKPGKGVALLVGILLLFMTCAQTYFNWWDWRQKNHS